MSIRTLITAALVAVCMATTAAWAAPKTNAAEGATTPTAQSAAQADKIIVYYFHGKARCSSCVKIEEYTAEAVRTGFAEELKAGSVEWHQVDTDEKKNAHFMKDYNLFTKSVVVVKVRDGRQVGFRNLDKVWEHLNSKERFVKYVQDETRAFAKAK